MNGSQIVKLKTGYNDVLKTLIKDNEQDFYERLKLRHRLKKILICKRLMNNSSNTTDCVHCSYTNETNKIVLIVTQIGDLDKPLDKIIICDNVLCTFSLGYLKEHLENIIEPSEALPQEKLTCIKRLGFGTFNKVIYI